MALLVNFRPPVRAARGDNFLHYVTQFFRDDFRVQHARRTRARGLRRRDGRIAAIRSSRQIGKGTRRIAVVVVVRQREKKKEKKTKIAYVFPCISVTRFDDRQAAAWSKVATSGCVSLFTRAPSRLGASWQNFEKVPTSASPRYANRVSFAYTSSISAGKGESYIRVYLKFLFSFRFYFLFIIAKYIEINSSASLKLTQILN